MTKNKVLILHTGGTIGSIKTLQGKAPAKNGAFSDLIRNHPKFYNNNKLPEFDIIEIDPLICSSNATPADWGKLSEKAAEQYNNYKGIVITHGTDTMSYSASALSFSLQNLAKPIIFTGAQTPLFEDKNDAEINLTRALNLASLDIPEVCVFFYEKLMKANRSVKINANDLHGFDSPRSPLIGKYKDNKFVFNKENLLSRSKNDFAYYPFKNSRVDVIHLFPGITVDFLKRALTPLPEGLIVETYGIGNAPSHEKMISFFTDIVQAGCIVVFVSECLVGTAVQGIYVANSVYKRAGIVYGHDMHAAAAKAKLHHLLDLGLEKEKIKKELVQSIAGEIFVE